MLVLLMIMWLHLSFNKWRIHLHSRKEVCTFAWQWTLHLLKDSWSHTSFVLVSFMIMLLHLSFNKCRIHFQAQVNLSLLECRWSHMTFKIYTVENADSQYEKYDSTLRSTAETLGRSKNLSPCLSGNTFCVELATPSSFPNIGLRFLRKH